jgi:hypothetical protein
MNRVRVGALLSVCIACSQSGPASADPLTPSLNALRPPPPAAQSPAPPPPTDAGARCTIATITADIGTNDTYLSRMSFAASPGPPGQRPLCPAGAAQAAARHALAACKQRASNSFNCVFGDMDHMFAISTELVDTSDLGAQCASYLSAFIGIACRPGDAADLCSIGCGDSAAEAIAAARKKCVDAHRGACPLTNAAPVQAP